MAILKIKLRGKIISYLTFCNIKLIIAKMNENTKQKFIGGLLLFPFIPIITLALAFFALSLTAFIYAVVVAIAFQSPMAFLVFFAGVFICLGLGILNVKLFINYIKYYAKSTGKSLKEKPKTKKVSDYKKYFTMTNICIFFLLIGSVCAIISAFLGSIHRENWVEAKSSYMIEKGFYEDIEQYSLNFPYTSLAKTSIKTDENGTEYTTYDDINIKIKVNNKRVILIYDEPSDMLNVKGYQSFKNQILCIPYYNEGLLTITETSQPKHDEAIDKMLWFLFAENDYESQVQLYIPINYKHSVHIEGDFVIAKKNPKNK